MTIVCGGAILVLSFAGAICHKVQYEFEHRFLEGADGDPDMADSIDKLQIVRANGQRRRMTDNAESS